VSALKGLGYIVANGGNGSLGVFINTVKADFNWPFELLVGVKAGA
jgi:hypothetical protein